MPDLRREHLVRFYSLLDRLERTLAGARTLAECTGRMDWPKKGVYFFREPGESRSDTGSGPRIVRVGTHALKTGSRAKLWTRLSQHKGRHSTGGGNHRGSIFRLIVGAALMKRNGYTFPTWGEESSASREIRAGEYTLECEVSRIIGDMPFLWLSVDDETGPQSMRGEIERHSIALLSNFNKHPIDPPSENWLGRYSDRERVQRSGLWNYKHVHESYDPAFLDEIERLISEMGASP